MKTKLSLIAVVLLSVALLSACKKEQEASAQAGQDAAAAINGTLEKAKDAAVSTEEAAKEAAKATADQAAAAVTEAKDEAVDAVQAAKDAAAAAANK